MKIAGQTMYRHERDDYYRNEKQDIIVEKHFDKWRGYHTTDEWGECAEHWVEGSFRYVVDELRKSLQKTC